MSYYKIDKDLFDKITEHINEKLDVSIDFLECLKLGNAKYFPPDKDDETGIIVVACRENNNRNRNFDNELALLLHEVGHFLQYKEKDDKTDLEKEENAWERGWKYMLKIKREKEMHIDIGLFKNKYEEVKKFCLESYKKKYSTHEK
ncbi:MAG: hypothetical protein Q7J67_07635 [bacterium]|nr:hypothetical protein [bacterium]